ncbi:hypothetical protein [Scytonema sp. NUACC26]|uniref:hypothetical protein n=1 Tax=Scytonema sp. NUACC26 TaxID=3140176 RepID=UPI0034DC4577
MKILQLVLSAVFLLTTPTLGAEYRGKNLDGKKLAATAYYGNTGGVYEVMVLFKENQAVIYFDSGSQTTIQLNQRAISDPNNIVGFGTLGQIPVNKVFRVGLVYNNDSPSNSQSPESPLKDFWKISLDKQEFNSFIQR